MIPWQADCFQHRAAVEALDAAADDGETAVPSQVHVLSGTGGVGKTQLAAHHARRQWESNAVDLLVWITASTRDAIVSAYALAGRDVTDAGTDDSEQAALDFLTWLQTTRRRWLVVLDDLRDLGDLTGLRPPQHSEGRVVITTRSLDVAAREREWRPVPVGMFTRQEAFAYLTARLGPDADEAAEQVHALAEDLGRLPLALAQAAAYMTDRALDSAAYRVRFADRRRTLAEVFPEARALPDDQRRTVAVTWSLSIELADQLTPVGLARPLLRLAGMLDANGFPLDVLCGAPALAYLTARRTAPDAGAGDPAGTAAVNAAGAAPVDAEAARDAVYCLRRLSLVELDTDTPERAVRVHGLIQRATRDELTLDEFDQVAWVAADALVDVWPGVEKTLGSFVLRANADALHTHAGPQLWLAGAHPLLLEAGRSLERARLLVSAGVYWDQLLGLAQQHLSPDHADTLAVRSSIATYQIQAGNRTGAVRTLRDLLADQERLLYPGHPDVLATRARFAHAQAEAHDHAGAMTTLRALLADQQRLLGPHHADTMNTRTRIANSHGVAGDHTHAIETLKSLLADQIRIRGAEHAETMNTLTRIAHWQGAAGDHPGAAGTLRGLLADQVRVLGADHHETMNTRTRIAQSQGDSGDRAGAIEALRELLADQIRVRGAEHAETMSTRARIAHWQFEAGHHAGDASVQDVLADQIRELGADHVSALATRARIAHQRGRAGDHAGAVDALRSLLTDQVRVLGEGHPETMSTRARIAHWQIEAGNRTGVVEALQDVLADQVRVLGDVHPDTMNTRARIAHWRNEAGNHAGVVGALEEVLADQIRILGDVHPDTFATRARIAQRLARAGDHAGALAALQKLLADQTQVLGASHPDNLITRARILHWRTERIEAGERAAVIEDLEQLLDDQVQTLGSRVHPNVVHTRASLAQQLGRAGDQHGAIDVLKDLLADQQRELDAGHPGAMLTRASIAHWQGIARDYDGAVRTLEDLLDDQERILGTDHPKTAGTSRALARWRNTQRREPKPARRSTGGQGHRAEGARAGQRGRPCDAQPCRPGRFFLRWRAADGTARSLGPFDRPDKAWQAASWARNGRGTDIEVVPEADDA